jgi:hypothetical protein
VLFVSLTAGTVDKHLAVEAAGTEQGGVKSFRPVRRGKQYDASRGVETVEFGEELSERLLLFVETTQATAMARAADGIEFVDEDDTGCSLARLFKEIANAGGADAGEYLDEFRTRYREKGDASFASDRTGKQCLARSGRPDEENAFGRSGADAPRRFWILEKGDKFLEL